LDPRPGPLGKVSDAGDGRGVGSALLGTIGRLLPGFFPELPDRTEYNRRLRRLTPWITTMQLMLAELVAEGQIRLADGTLIACANYRDAPRKASSPGTPATGTARRRASSSGACGSC
jgi:hypothetical protein